MRKILIICALLVTLGSCSRYQVYSMRDNPKLPVDGGVLYALPKTQLCVAITLQHRDISSAPYRDYAVEYLGLTDEDIDTSFEIANIDVSTRDVADADNYFMVKMSRGSLTVDSRRFLIAVGMPNPSDNNIDILPDSQRMMSFISQPLAEYNLYDRADTLYSRYDTPGNPTLVSYRKDSRSVKQRAMAAAEKLESIGQRRQELLEGDYEGSYSMETVKYMDCQLRMQEDEIVRQFCGTVTGETVCFYVEPFFRRQSDVVDTIVWFSPSMGLLGDDSNLPEDAVPVVCNICGDNEMRSANRFVKYHTSGITSDSKSGKTGRAFSKRRNVRNFRYRIPEGAVVEVNAGNYSVKKQVKMAQLGPIMTLPKGKIKALFDAKTLELRELTIDN